MISLRAVGLQHNRKIKIQNPLKDGKRQQTRTLSVPIGCVKSNRVEYGVVDVKHPLHGFVGAVFEAKAHPESFVCRVTVVDVGMTKYAKVFRMQKQCIKALFRTFVYKNLRVFKQ